MRAIRSLAILLLTIASCRATDFVINWTYQYEVASPGTKSESVYGKLYYRQDELPKEYAHVITPIGEFVFVDRQGSGSTQKIGWVPYGRLTGYPAGTLNPAHIETEVQELLTGDESVFRRAFNSGAASTASTKPSLPGSFDKHPKGVGKEWFYAVKQGLWVNPANLATPAQK
jgi:hypothetical protein